MSDFEELLGETLHGMANTEPAVGFGERMAHGFRAVQLGQEESAMAGVSVHLGGTGVAELGVWASLWANVRGALSSAQAPEMVLGAQPLPGKLPQARREMRPLLAALMVHAGVIMLIGLLVARKMGVVVPVRTTAMVALDAPLPKALPRSLAMGGGGGQRGVMPVSKGTPPRFAEQQIVPPKAAPEVEAKLAVEPTIKVQRDLKMASEVPQIGVANSPIVGMSMGNGYGSGLGSGRGDGLGPGSGANTGGGVRRIGGGVSAPQLVYSVEPEFSEEARKSKTTGNVIVNLWVDAAGNPSHVHVVRGIGMGLDERAVAAVRQYRFKPAMENGKPVLVELNVEVDFQIF